MSARFRGALGLCLSVLSLAAQAAEKRLDRTFTVAPGGRLTVDTSASDVRVSGTSTNQVVVHVRMTGSKSFLEHLELSAEQSGNDVAVIAKRGSRSWGDWFRPGWNMGGQITVEVPSEFDVELQSAGGDLEILQLRGDAQGKTSGGDIRIADIHGPVRMHTSGGDIRSERVDGEAQLRTSGGNIDVARLSGNLEAVTSGGYIHLQDIRGSVIARSSGGDVVATRVEGDSKLRTSGGDIDAAIDGKITAHTSSGSITAELVGANRGVAVTSSGGDITLRVPRDVAAELNASTSGGSVRSELPVTTTDAGERRLIGTINGGGPLIRARTSGGDVRLQARN